MSALILELLVWLAARPRTYEQTMDAWRTSCPRNPVWEDATTDGLIEVLPGPGVSSAAVRLTASGWAVLAAGADGECAGSCGFGKDID